MLTGPRHNSKLVVSRARIFPFRRVRSKSLSQSATKLLDLEKNGNIDNSN